MSSILSVPRRPINTAFWRAGSITVPSTGTAMNAWSISTTYEFVHTHTFTVVGIHFALSTAVTAGTLTLNILRGGSTDGNITVTSSDAAEGAKLLTTPLVFAPGVVLDMEYDADASLAGPAHFMCSAIMRF